MGKQERSKDIGNQRVSCIAHPLYHMRFSRKQMAFRRKFYDLGNPSKYPICHFRSLDHWDLFRQKRSGSKFPAYVALCAVVFSFLYPGCRFCIGFAASWYAYDSKNHMLHAHAWHFHKRSQLYDIITLFYMEHERRL